MPRLLPAFPNIPSHQVPVELDGESYIVRFQWRPRLRGWYMSLFTEEREPLWRQRRLTPDISPNLHIERPPPGLFLVRGPERYARDTLGEDLQVIYYSEDEVFELDQGQNFSIVG